jgi:hypothetical protein
MTDNQYLDMLAMEDKYTPKPSIWQIAKAFQECRKIAQNEAKKLSARVEGYNIAMLRHPVPEIIFCWMKIDRKIKRYNELKKFLEYTKPSRVGDLREDDKQKAKNTPIISLFNFRRRGSKVACPFHPDKTPSAIINKNNTFHCFSCDLHMDSIAFIQKLYGISFNAAIRRLTNGD